MIHEAPVAVITPSQDRSPTDTLSGLRDLDLHSSDVEITTESVVSNPPLATPVITAGISTPTLATTQSPIPTPINAVNPLPVLDQPAIIPTRSPPTVPQQDTEANRYAPQSLGEVTPIPTVVPAPIEVLAPPTDAPASVAAKEVIDRKETSAADGGAHRFVLSSASGGEVSLDEYLERGNVILVFYRAFW